jgi:four helix bundle protein
MLLPHSYKELIVWQKSKALAVEIYRLTQGFPANEMYGLTAQVRRAAISVPCNIAEGQGRLTKGEFRQFLGQARGSVLEVQTQLMIAAELAYLTEQQLKDIEAHTAEILRLLNGLLGSLRGAPETRISKPETRNRC